MYSPTLNFKDRELLALVAKNGLNSGAITIVKDGQSKWKAFGMQVLGGVALGHPPHPHARVSGTTDSEFPWPGIRQ